MKDYLLDWFPVDPLLAVFFSIIINTIVAILGIIPSAFITAGNIVYFGFNEGLLVSIAGEATGAIVSFLLYRKGLIKLLPSFKFSKSKYLLKLKKTSGAEAFFLVLLLRLLPFIPSGAVTFAAAFSTMRLMSFSIASTLGKIPSLFIEAYSVDQVLSLKTEWQFVMVILFILISSYFILRKKK